MDPEPVEQALFFFQFVLLNIGFLGLSISVLVLVALLVASALISGSEIAFFSLSPSDNEQLKEDQSQSSKTILKLNEHPAKLLATILISNNFINIAIVILSTFILEQLIPVGSFELGGNWLATNILTFTTAVIVNNTIHYLITVVSVTFLLVLFGEVAPKIYASFNNIRFASVMAKPLDLLNRLFGAFSNILVKWSDKMESSLSQGNNNSPTKADLDHAIELTVNQHTSVENEADILRGIIKFSDLSVKQIMRPKLDIVGFEKTGSFKDLMKLIRKSGYSRIPIYEESMDTIIGILYVKDLIGLTSEKDDFAWFEKIRNKLIFVPETKKVNELLKDIQRERVHMAIVVDEYGGVSGLVTLEDVMEEVIGDIKDEFDGEEDVDYVKIDDNNYIFEGKTNLTDVARAISIDSELFDKSKGESDTLAGLILEILGFIPKKDREVIVGNIKLKVAAVNKRRVEKVALTILK